MGAPDAYSGNQTMTGPWRGFRILIETEGGVSYSWGTAQFVQMNSTHTATEIVNLINGANFTDRVPREFENAPLISGEFEPTTSAASRFGPGYGNVWLACNKTNLEQIGFEHTHTTDSADPLLRVKFYGSFVCDMLGLATDVWHYTSGFNLSTSDLNQSVFSGHVLADEIAIKHKAVVQSGCRWNGSLVFDVSGSEEIDHGITFVGGGDLNAQVGYFGWDPVSTGSVAIASAYMSASEVRSSGDVVALYSSDKRLKDNIEYILDPVSKVKQLNGIEFQWNDSQSVYPVGTKDVGIIAQDLQKVYPELVATSSHGYLGVKHDRLVALLIEAVKEQSNEIDTLKLRISNLENK